MDIPLKIFCKEEGFYYFGNVTLAEHLELLEELASGSLTRERIMALYRANLSEQISIGLIDEASEWCEHFAKRRQILSDAISIHFAGKYTLSVPALFAQIEGLLRDIGALSLSAKFKPTIPDDIWNSRLMFGESDNAEYFNAFISRLFEGQQSAESFARNSVLHGANTNYNGEDHSLILILTILEIRKFLWLRDHTHPLVHNAVR